MSLKEFSLISPVIQAGEVLTALESAIAPVAIEQAIGDTEAREERERALPSHLVVCLVIAMSLWSKDTGVVSAEESSGWSQVLLRSGSVNTGKYPANQPLLKPDSESGVG